MSTLDTPLTKMQTTGMIYQLSQPEISLQQARGMAKLLSTHMLLGKQRKIWTEFLQSLKYVLEWFIRGEEHLAK